MTVIVKTSAYRIDFVEEPSPDIYVESVFRLGSCCGDVGCVETFVGGRFGPDFEMFHKRVSRLTSTGRHKHSFPLKHSSALFCQEMRSYFSFVYDVTSSAVEAGELGLLRCQAVP